MSRFNLKNLILVFILITVFIQTKAGASPNGEISAMASYSKTDYGNNTYSYARKYVGALGVYITSVTQIEGSYTNSETYFDYSPVQTSDLREQILGLSIVQNLVPSSWFFQPYVKVGGAQYNRKQTGTVANIATIPVESKSPSAILGGGVRIFLLHNFSLKGEAITILPDGRIHSFRQNFSVQAGVGWTF